jgi:hypothetical protein
MQKTKTKKLRALSTQANYTNRVAAAYLQS